MTRVGAAALVLTTGMLLAACAATADAVMVRIDGDTESGSRLEPSTVTIPAGGEVRWHNGGTRMHVLESVDGAFGGEDEVRLGVGETYSTRFEEPGSYVYRFISLGDQPAVGVVEVTEP